MSLGRILRRRRDERPAPLTAAGIFADAAPAVSDPVAGSIIVRQDRVRAQIAPIVSAGIFIDAVPVPPGQSLSGFARSYRRRDEHIPPLMVSGFFGEAGAAPPAEALLGRQIVMARFPLRQRDNLSYLHAGVPSEAVAAAEPPVTAYMIAVRQQQPWPQTGSFLRPGIFGDGTAGITAIDYDYFIEPPPRGRTIEPAGEN